MDNPLASELQAYVMENMSFTQTDAIAWLDKNAPHWRKNKIKPPSDRVFFEGEDNE